MPKPLKAEAATPAVTVNDSHDGRVRELILGGSRGNLITRRLVEELRDAMRSAAKTRKLKLIVIDAHGVNASMYHFVIPIELEESSYFKS